jgi:shikimate dehydrogenase
MERYAVIGNPIAHSKSPQIHTLFAEQCQQDLQYTAILSSDENFEKDLDAFFEEGQGLNVTLPFKIKAMHYANELSESAKQAGAVNTLIKKENKIIGDNTDGIGLVRDLVDNHKQQLKNKNVLILGAGGATRGVIAPLVTEKVSQVFIANRTLEKAEALVEHFSQGTSVPLQALALSKVVALENIDIVINASSAGLSGETSLLPENISQCFCYDMVYGSEQTPFLKDALAKGCQGAADGLGMLVEQAAESFFLWRSVRPETKSVLGALRASL